MHFASRRRGYMPGFFRIGWLVVLGGVGCALVASVPAGAQESAAAEQSRSAAAPSEVSIPVLHRVTHADTFGTFMQEIGADDLAARKEAITGEKQQRVDWKAVNHVFIGLTDEEWAIAYSILLDGSQKVANWGDAMQEALGWKDGRYQSVPPGHAAERLAALESLSDQDAPIVDHTMDVLRQNLGDRAFSRLDSFVYRREGGRRIINPNPIQRGPIETANASAPAASAPQK